MKNDRQVISVRQTLIIALAGIICPSQQHDLSTPIDWYDTSIAFVDKDEFTSTGMSIENYTNNKPSQTQSRDDVEYDITDPILQNFTQSEGVKEVDENDLVVEDEQCRLYLAESTIPNAGWGLFVGVDINENEQFSASGDGIIPFETLLSDDCLIGEYTWEEDEVNFLGFGLRALPNCFFSSINVHYDILDIQEPTPDWTWRNPGFGATTLSYATDGGVALFDLKAGTELFVDYGKGYFEDDLRINRTFGLVPFVKHYEQADQLLDKFRNVYNTVVDIINNCRDLVDSGEVCFKDKLTKFNLDGTTSTHAFQRSDLRNDFYQLTQTVLKIWPSRLQGAMQIDVDEIDYVLDYLGSTSEKFASRSIRSVDYLKEHGSCLDHMYIANSTIPFAGRGSFAKTFLAEGTVVAPLPLVHARRSVLTLDTDKSSYSDRHIERHELLLNYCFGHGKSSLILCPHGVASSLVNHPGKHREANVRLEWSRKMIREPAWLDMPLNEWISQMHTGLVFEYVAIRDIEKDEEILLDYSMEWQDSWDEHVHRFHFDKHVQFAMLNSRTPPIELIDYQNDALVQATNEKEIQVHLWCRNAEVMFHSGYPVDTSDPDIALYQPCRVLGQLPVDKISFQEYIYTAELVVRQFEYENLSGHNVSIPSCSERNTGQVVFGLSRDAFVFAGPMPNEIDPVFSETWAFRHEIRIPDRLMPELWKDL